MKNISKGTLNKLSVNEKHKLITMQAKLEQLKLKTITAQRAYSIADDQKKPAPTLNKLRKAGFDCERKLFEFDDAITAYKNSLIKKYNK